MMLVCTTRLIMHGSYLVDRLGECELPIPHQGIPDQNQWDPDRAIVAQHVCIHFESTRADDSPYEFSKDTVIGQTV